MSIQGFLIELSHSYETPNCCASCMGPRQTQVEARFSEKSGNIRTTLTMSFPYCDPCAKRARWEKVRQVIVGVLAALFGVALAIGAWGVDIGVGASIRFAIALPLGAIVALLLALLTRQSIPAPPATARGEAVILRDTSGTVLCTSPQFAELLGTANGRTPKPGVHRLTVEVWAPITSLLVAVLVLLYWVKAGAPEGTDTTSPPAAAKAANAPRATPAPAKKATPAASTKKH